MTYSEAIKLITGQQRLGKDFHLSDDMWKAILEAVTEEITPKPISNLPDPDFSLEEMDQAETVIKSLGPR